MLFVPLFSMAEGGKYGEIQGGIFFYGGYSYAWKRLIVNVIGVLSITAWSILWSFLIFGCLKMAKLLRIDEETEFFGIDVAKHGEASYPMDAWVKAPRFQNRTSGFPKPFPVGVETGRRHFLYVPLNVSMRASPAWIH